LISVDWLTLADWATAATGATSTVRQMTARQEPHNRVTGAIAKSPSPRLLLSRRRDFNELFANSKALSSPSRAAQATKNFLA
jgi:hypothetical protein